MFSRLKSCLFIVFSVVFFMTSASAAGIADAAVTAIQQATTDVNPVYVAVIAAFAGFFVVKMIKRAL